MIARERVIKVLRETNQPLSLYEISLKANVTENMLINRLRKQLIERGQMFLAGWRRNHVSKPLPLYVGRIELAPAFPPDKPEPITPAQANRKLRAEKKAGMEAMAVLRSSGDPVLRAFLGIGASA